MYYVEVGCFEESSWHYLLKPEDRLDILEPIPANIERVRAKYKSWDNVTVHPYAVWKENCQLWMHNIGVLSYVEGIACPAITLGYEPKEEKLIEVEAITFDKFDKGDIEMMDIDVEGAEWYVIQRMISRPNVIVVETGTLRNHPHIDEIDNWMDINGYDQFAHQETNSFFRKRSKE